jgi:hypothetical protein
LCGHLLRESAILVSVKFDFSPSTRPPFIYQSAHNVLALLPDPRLWHSRRMQKRIPLGFTVGAAVIAALVIWSAWSSQETNLLAVGNFAVLTLTLIVLVWYAYDTNSIARVTLARWQREGVLSTTYEMQLIGEKGIAGKTMFRLHNSSTLVVRARVACNFRVYGDPVRYHPAYDGTDLWILFPQQVSQGWFEIEPLLQAKGKSVTGMMSEHSPVNSKQQLTMFLELEFWDELGAHRKLPGRLHYFDFERWAWIPHLTEEHSTVQEKPQS